MHKGVEFGPFESRVVQLLPQTQKLYRVFRAQPVFNQVLGLLRIFIARYIRKGDKILFFFRKENDLPPLNCNAFPYS